MPWQELTLSSQALEGNPLGDSHERPLFVWAPAGTSRRYPTVYVLHAHMRSARSWFNVTPFETSYPDAIEALQPDAVVVLVDGTLAYDRRAAETTVVALVQAIRRDREAS